jgi:protein-tyrosine phosphatase
MTANDARHADLILTMTANHKAKVVELYPEVNDKTRTIAEYATGVQADVPDAWGKPLEVYIAMLKQLDAYLPRALEKAVAAPR